MSSAQAEPELGLQKAPTGIEGFDAITYGGLPKGRPTLVCGSAGCGKTLFAMEFLVRGALEFGEPGVFVAFEESPEDLATNVASLGFDLADLQAKNLIRIDYVKVDRAEIEESGEYDLEGLFIRLNHFIDQIGAKRVVLDTIETIFSGLSNQAILRNELQRLFHWLKDKGVTAVITGERGSGQLTRQGLEEYVSDCVILLDHRVIDEVSTRRMRIVKYRGTVHGTNEYPFLIDEEGFTVLPVTNMSLVHSVTQERVSTGVAALDEMLGGEGVYRGSSILLTGTSGTGKSSLCAHFADATCRRGEKCIYFAFEEAVEQIVRNMQTIGVDLRGWIDQGLLIIQATRPMHHGLEMHLATMQRMIARVQPSTVIVDPISNLQSIGSNMAISAMLIRLVDFLKARTITALFSNLTSGDQNREMTEVGLSSIMDNWILLRDIELNGERNRGLYVLKSRGTNHSNQIREFLITRNGVHLRNVYLGPEGVLTGSARVAQEARERERQALAKESYERQRALSERKKRALEAQIAALQAEIDAEDLLATSEARDEDARLTRSKDDLQEMLSSRTARNVMNNRQGE
ncbi:MAG TPA: circadian clock protein KaiC [Fimbriimonas sp.]|nr:circadian clock protein KaiC [Fimbriimonas sp.]